MKILELGGGHNPYPFETNLYKVVYCDWNKEWSDVIHNLNKFPYPFKNKSFDVIYSSHCLEHLNDKFKFFDECNRILKDNGKIIVRVPHYRSSQAFNIDHVSFWRCGSMAYFQNADFYGNGKIPHFKLIRERLLWRVRDCIRPYYESAEKYTRPTYFYIKSKKYGWLDYFINWLINLNIPMQQLTEMLLYIPLLGIDEVEFVLEKVKL